MQTLDIIRERRLVPIETTKGLRVRHQHRHHLLGLKDALAAYAEPLRAWLRLGGHDANVPAPWCAPGWDAETRLFAAWFGLHFESPSHPVSLHPGETITKWTRYRTSVMDRLALGPDGPTADRLRAELRTLFVLFGQKAISHQTHSLPLAA